MSSAVRWSDHDRYFGPFTWAYDKTYSNWAVTLKSRGDDSSDGGKCYLRISVSRATLIVALPGIIQPHRTKVFTDWDAETVKRLGRNWYWNVHPRQYGVSLHDGHLTVYFGRVTHDSRTDESWGCFLPWTQWRHVRHSYYGVNGEHVYTEAGGRNWLAALEARDACPSVNFLIDDYDGERITATTRIEEREWRFGTGCFKWLSWFRKPMIRRSLDISFSAEVGRDKGSWKGGTVGTGIDMLPDEDHEAAFRRFCAEDHRSKNGKYRVTFVSKVSA